jgi:hypothetical protein
MGGKVKGGLGFEGIKGGKRERERAFFGFWFLAEIGLESREEGLTGLLVGVGKPQLKGSGSSAFEAS